MISWRTKDSSIANKVLSVYNSLHNRLNDSLYNSFNKSLNNSFKYSLNNSLNTVVNRRFINVVTQVCKIPEVAVPLQCNSITPHGEPVTIQHD